MASQNYIVDRGRAPRAVTPKEAHDYRTKGFMNRLGQIAPYGIMAGMGYGAGAGAFGAGAAGGAGGAAGGVPSMPWTLGAGSYGATAPAVTGGGPVAGGFFRSLGKFFGSPGGAELTRLGGDLAGGYLQNRGMNRATDLSANANADTLAWLKAQDARDFAEYEKERTRNWAFEDEDRRYGLEDRAHKYKREGEREGRLAPFRDGAERGYQTLSSLLFNPGQRMSETGPISNAVQRRSLADLMRGSR